VWYIFACNYIYSSYWQQNYIYLLCVLYSWRQQTYCIKCTLRKVLTDSSDLNNIKHLGLKQLHSQFPGVSYYGVMDLLTTFVINIFIQFSIKSVLIANFMNNFFVNIFLCKFLKSYQAKLNLFSVLNRLHWCSSYIKTATSVLIRLPCLIVSSFGKTWRGWSVLGGRRDLDPDSDAWHSTRDWKLRSVWSRHHVWSPMDYHQRYPKTLLPKVLVSNRSVSNE
jgi:hypothetical protein